MADKHGLNYLGSVGTLEDIYLFEDHRIVKRSTEKSSNHHNLMADDAKIVWFDQQTEKKRTKRNSSHKISSLPTDPQFRFDITISFTSILMSTLFQIAMAFK